MKRSEKYVEKIVPGIALLALIAVGIFFTTLSQKNFQQTRPVEMPQFLKIGLNGATIRAEVMQTPDDLERGLSGRNELGADEGMWFDFGRRDMWGMWMKGMKFSIDIVWLDETYKIITVAERIAPETYPEIFYPDRAALFALELPDGAVEKYSIKAGDRVFLR